MTYILHAYLLIFLFLTIHLKLAIVFSVLLAKAYFSSNALSPMTKSLLLCKLWAVLQQLCPELWQQCPSAETSYWMPCVTESKFSSRPLQSPIPRTSSTKESSITRRKSSVCMEAISIEKSNQTISSRRYLIDFAPGPA